MCVCVRVLYIASLHVIDYPVHALITVVRLTRSAKFRPYLFLNPVITLIGCQARNGFTLSGMRKVVGT